MRTGAWLRTTLCMCLISLKILWTLPKNIKESVEFAWFSKRVCVRSTDSFHFLGEKIEEAHSNKEPDFLAMSEQFAGKVHHVWAICRFFSPCLSAFTQTWHTFQACSTHTNHRTKSSTLREDRALGLRLACVWSVLLPAWPSERLLLLHSS